MSLRASLARAREPHGFISISKLREVVTDTAVRNHLEEKGIKLSRPLDSKIIATSQKLIAILILLGLERHIESAITQGNSDNVFPIKQASLTFLEDNDDKHRFCVQQWSVPLAFSHEQHMELPRDAILPFLSKTRISHGTFGMVYKVRVASGHLLDYGEHNFALKSIEVDDTDRDNVLMREVIALRKRPHENIVPLLASFTRADVESSVEIKTINLVFPYAEMDMEAWMSLNDAPFEFAERNRRIDLYQSTCELVSALAFLHRENIDGFSTAHHDLKPRNILVFGRKWKIADFGRTRLRSSIRGSETEGKDGLGSYDYHPPEYYNDDGSRASRGHGRPFDIWAMGCIMLQVAVLVVYSWESGMVDEFRNSRCNLSSNERRFIKKKDGQDSSFHNSLAEVDRWISKLMGDGSKMLQQFLETTIQMLRGDPKERLASWEAELDLYEMLHPDDSIAQRLEISRARIPPVKKSTGGPLLGKHLHRAAMGRNAARAVCLVEAGWRLEPPDNESSVMSPVPDEPPWNELQNVHGALEHVAISKFRNKVLQQSTTHSIEPYGFQLVPENMSSHQLGKLREISSTDIDERYHLDQRVLTDLRRAIMYSRYNTVQDYLNQLPNKSTRWKDNYGKNPLHYAAEYQTEEAITKLILEESSSPSALILQEDLAGQTPLHIVAKNGAYETVLLFLPYVDDQAAAVRLKDVAGNSPLSLAHRSGNSELILLLESGDAFGEVRA